MLKCDKQKKKHDGACKRNDCICPLFVKPVCGIDGKTYSNACFLACAKVKLRYEGDCKKIEDCKIDKSYHPVCGVNGKTYSNLSSLICEKVKLKYEGKC